MGTIAKLGLTTITAAALTLVVLSSNTTVFGAPTKTLQAAVTAGDVKPVGTPYAVSDDTNLALKLRLSDMQSLPLAVANWPQRVNGCGPTSSSWPNSSPRKTLPFVPVYPTALDYDGEGIAYGNWRAWSGPCEDPDSGSYGYDADTLAFDSGTDVIPAWATFPGFSISPTAYGGWGMSSFVPTPIWQPAVHTDYETWWDRRPGCDGLEGTVATSWLNVENPDTPLYHKPMHDSAHAIWSENCRDLKNWYPSIYLSNGYTNAFLSANNSYYYKYWREIETILNLGTTLFRKTFTLTADEIALITAAEDRNGGLGLDILADDFHAVYLNGKNVDYSTYTVTAKRYMRVNSADLRVGENVLAIEVNDKVAIDTDPASSATGLMYTLQLYDKSGYELLPQTTCYSGGVPVTSVTSGALIQCRHVFPMTPSSTLSNTLRTRTRVDCAFTGYTPAPAVAADCRQALNPAIGTPGTIYARATLNTYTITKNFTLTGPDGSQVCTSLYVTPGSGTDSGTAGVARTGTPWCVTIGSAVSPLVYFRKGDVFANSTISGAEVSPRRSHGDYAVIANGAITKFSSGATGSAGITNSLTFANTPSSGFFGQATSFILPVVPGPTLPAAPTVNLNSLASGNYVYSGDIKINTTAVIDKQIRIKATGTITIDNNIDLSTAVTTPKLLPYVLLVSDGDLIINEAVTRVGATLVSGGVLRTCDKATVSTTICNQKLVISGPIAARSIGLYRTATGGVGDYDGAAEVVSYEPAALVAPYTALQSSSLVTDIEIELPPRY